MSVSTGPKTTALPGFHPWRQKGSLKNQNNAAKLARALQDNAEHMPQNGDTREQRAERLRSSQNIDDPRSIDTGAYSSMATDHYLRRVASGRSRDDGNSSGIN